ncbi:hypothetical protein [Propionispora sp. 2/2-37]|uniref:hypothetical protein n=1 Tax=Propionispora sp. 2/2-37 TaxID=1677858 RepID=UPI001F3EF228|nr:hypothetical protein [Propionispora sp. 2/2-37]
MRRLLNDPEHVVEEMLEGYVLAHGKHVRLLEDDGRVIVNNRSPVRDKVAIIIGGGSGMSRCLSDMSGKALPMRLLSAISIHRLHRNHAITR